MKHVYNPYAEKFKYENGLPMMYGRKILLQNMTISLSPWNHYWYSACYVADIWSDVNNLTFTLFRKGKWAYHYDQYVRDHKDFMKQAKEDTAFIDKHGREVFDQIEKDSTKTLELKIEKQQEEREFISKPNDGYTRPDEEKTKQKWQEEFPPMEYDIKYYKQTDFKALAKFKNFKNEQQMNEYFIWAKEQKQIQKEEKNKEKERIKQEKEEWEKRQLEKKEEQAKIEEEERKKNEKKSLYKKLIKPNQEEEKKEEEKKEEEKKEEEKKEDEEDEKEEEEVRVAVTPEQYREYGTMLIKRSRAFNWRNLWIDPIIEQLAQYDFFIDKEMFMTRIQAYLPSFTIPNYHQEFNAKYSKAISRLIARHKFNKFTVFQSAIQNREFGWPYKPRLDINYSPIVAEYNPNCKFILYNIKKGRDDIFFKFGKITWNRFFMEVRYPFTLLNAFGLGLSAIKNYYIFHGKFG